MHYQIKSCIFATMKKEYISIPEFARNSGVSHQYVYRIIDLIPTIVIGGRRFVSKEFRFDFQSVKRKSNKNK